MLAGLYAGGPQAGVTADAEGGVLRLCAPDGRPLVSVEAPQLVQVPGEAERLLGREVPVPFWWTEVRASGAVPEAGRLAESVCGRLALLLGGSTWPGPAGTEVVDVRAAVAPDDGQPVVDVLTDSTSVVLAGRPVLALTTWLSDVLRGTARSGRALQIVTPSHVRAGAPARATLLQTPNRWVVQDPAQGYYDGLSGAVLRWHDGTFVPALAPDGTARVADAFGRTSPTDEQQLVVAFRTSLPAHEHTVLGEGLETAWRALTGSAPAGWGTAEPVNLPWSPRRLTDLARDRAPEPTHLLVTGHPGRPALAWLRVTRTTAGIEQDVTLHLGYGADEEPPLEAIAPLAEALVTGHGLTTMLTSLRRASRDLTTPPVLQAPPVPVAFTLGARDVRDIGLTHARRPPVDVRPAPLGPASEPALHYPLGDGTDAAALVTLRHLGAHLRAGTPGATADG
ncbi:DUF6177 family protein [Streptomyces sp. DSM 41972]|uniref:DUF6177 family protein n=1 Tax=Streptomyces althioticus subsp. attaecolombicae TaxID=3075534 RepID=A0ABU3HYM0_9ACTN|nr:DUF6177 family protein [Streptomyces sp. DSM 41972]SCD79594.1 hypothetical protein GA0115238_125213 [Streptomyces sp. di50b]SCD92225.1 hypothetical protein GA0115245_116713 [Streptomyces sp. di188]